ncbi:MAG: OmpA family protein [Bryobacteraceae bacterium]
MADSGPIRPAKTDTGPETPVNGDLAELRQLLLGPERAQLDELQERIENRSRRANDLSEVLPDAILLRARKDPSLRQTLQPILEEALAVSVRKDPSIIAKALFPAIGGAIRRAVATALQEMIESLNHIIETGFSLRSLGWRIEAIRTGRPYGEIALLRSLLYRVEQVFLIQNDTGLLLQHVMCDSAVVRDPDMVSGMLTAIQNFVQDSFGAPENTLETVRLGDFSVWIQHGPAALLAAVVRGAAPPRIRGVFSSALETIHQDYGAQLASTEGDSAMLDRARPVLQTCLLGQSPPRRRMSLWPIYLLGVALLVAVGLWVGLSIRESRRWERYLAALSEEPGIVVTHQERRGGRFAISGLRDPLSRDPAQLLQSAGIPSDRVRLHWEPYLSLSPRFVALRELPELRSRLERQVIHFETGKSVLLPAAVESVRVVAGLAGGLMRTAAAAGKNVRIEIVGHTDEVGSEERNSQLGMDRATAVNAALAALGVDASVLSVRSAGSTEPLPAADARSRRAENRSASFRVLP